MKRRMIAITAFMAATLAGCGQINEPLATTNSNDQPAANIEIQTEIHTDAVTYETITETKRTSTTQQTTEETSMGITSTTSVAETQAEYSAVDVISENNDTPQSQPEETQSVTESEKPAVTESTTQAVRDNCYPVVADNGQTADVFKMLDSLNYQAISCDGLPTHKLTAPDGTVYYLHLDENASYSYVWRRPSLIADADNEAPLTQEVIEAIYANWDQLNIEKTDW